MRKALIKQENIERIYPSIFEKSNNQSKIMSFYTSIIPIIILFLTVIFFGMFSDVNGVYPAMILSIIYFMVVHKGIDDLNKGVMNAYH